MKIQVTKPSILFEVLVEHYPDSPRTRLKKLLQNGGITVNGRKVSLHSFTLKKGDEVEISKERPKQGPVLPLPLLYEDEHLIIIDKPAGLSTSSIDGSINAQFLISKYLRDLSKGQIRSYVVHRLDKEVSGIVLFAKSPEIMEQVKTSWEKTEKHYLALVEGKPGKPEDTIKSLLAEAGKQKVKSFKPGENREAKLAITRYKVLRIIGQYTLLDVNIITGRKNQIRVHLSEMGCPIVGDRKYGAEDEFIRRVRLHAYMLEFPHPVTGSMIKTESPMPAGFLTIKQLDENYK